MSDVDASPLTVDGAVAYLLSRKLLSLADVVEGEVCARGFAYRHRHLRIERGNDGGGWLLKQSEPCLADAERSFHVEELFYRLCRDERRLSPLLPFLAPPRHVDAARRLLIFELVPGIRPLAQALASAMDRDEELPNAPMAALGRSLATLHRAGSAVVREPGVRDLDRRRPAVFAIHRPKLGVAARISGAQRQLLEIVQERPEMSRGLDDAAVRWVDAEDAGGTLVHGDVRSDNVLVPPPDAGGEAIRLVDWELLAVGDPAWDVAGALQDLVDFWIRGLPLGPDLSAGERVERARRPLAAIQPLFASFRRGYAEVAGGLDVDRAVSFSAVRLVQTAWEWAQDAAELPAPAVMMLQVSANILQDPKRASGELYGFAESEGTG